MRKPPSLPRSWANFSPFYRCIPMGMHGPTCIFWANLTPFSLARRTRYLSRRHRSRTMYDRMSMPWCGCQGTSKPASVSLPCAPADGMGLIDQHQPIDLTAHQTPVIGTAWTPGVIVTAQFVRLLYQPYPNSSHIRNGSHSASGTTLGMDLGETGPLSQGVTRG